MITSNYFNAYIYTHKQTPHTCTDLSKHVKYITISMQMCIIHADIGVYPETIYSSFAHLPREAKAPTSQKHLVLWSFCKDSEQSTILGF